MARSAGDVFARLGLPTDNAEITHPDREEFLAHYGVKGMKWGVRRDGPPRAQARAEKKDRAWTSNAQAAFNKVARAAGTQMNQEVLPKINEKYVVEGKGIPKAKFDAYTKEVQSAYSELLDMHMVNQIGRSPSGKHELKWHTEHADSKLPWAELVYTDKTLGHAETEELIVGLVKNVDGTVTLKIVARDKIEELIADIKEVDHAMADDIDDFLAHYGVKGMKWGVRKRSSESSDDSSSGGKKYKVNPDGSVDVPVTRNSGTGKDVAITPKGKLASDDAATKYVVGARIKALGLDAVTNSELKAYNERLNLERGYKEALAKQPTTFDVGHRKLKKMVSFGKTASEAYTLVNSPAGKSLRGVLDSSAKSAGKATLAVAGLTSASKGKHRR